LNLKLNEAYGGTVVFTPARLQLDSNPAVVILQMKAATPVTICYSELPYTREIGADASGLLQGNQFHKSNNYVKATARIHPMTERPSTR